MTQLEGVEKETDVGVRTAAVNLLIRIAVTQKSDIVLDILGELEKVQIILFLLFCFPYS